MRPEEYHNHHVLLVRVAYTLCATLLSFVGIYYAKIDWLGMAVTS